jgi:uncharacterized membrane protein
MTIHNSQFTIYGTQPAGKRRAGFVDELRGLDIIVMTLYHACYDLVFIFRVEVPYFRSFAMPYVQPCIAWVFIVLSGISCRYSRSNLKRGLRTLLFGLCLTAVTVFLMPSESIYYGILHFMGTAMLLFAALRPLIAKIPAHAGMICSLLLFVLTLDVPTGTLGAGAFSIALPETLYANPLFMPLGFGGMGADYFPLVPNFFLYLAGAFAGTYVAQGRLPEWFYATRASFLAAIGRRTIIIYLLHQPVLIGLFTLLLG